MAFVIDDENEYEDEDFCDICSAPNLPSGTCLDDCYNWGSLKYGPTTCPDYYYFVKPEDVEWGW